MSSSEDEMPPLDLEKELMFRLENHDKYSCLIWLDNLPCEEKLAKRISHYLHLEGSQNCVRAVIEALSSDNEGTPLHKVACRGAASLTNLFLTYGEDPNIRVDSKIYGWKQALPLNVALRGIRPALQSARDASALRLICNLCTFTIRDLLETARLLALQTKDIDQEIFKYMKEGKVEELSALMLLGYHSRFQSLEFFEGDESTKKQMVQLVDIFQKIGDKLQTYIMIQRSLSKVNRPGKVVADIASLFEDAGLSVEGRDTFMDRGLDRFVRDENGNNRFGINDGKKALYSNAYRVPHLNSLNQVVGSRSLHTSSVIKAHKDIAYSSQVRSNVVWKSQFWRNSSFLMRALRNAVRHV